MSQKLIKIDRRDFPIKIDLRDLTPEKLAESEPFMGVCDYAAPCIIGSLIPLELREHVADIANNSDADEVDDLTEDGIFELVPGQEKDALALQHAYDSSRWEKVVEIASRYMAPQVEV